MNEIQKCALCGSDKKLELSHIVPKMVARHLKKTSVGGVRNTANPNRIVQDSEKHYMLCADCERRFSRTETYFANNIFYKFQRNSVKVFPYSTDFFYFVTSVSWRSLYLDIIDFTENEIVGSETLNFLRHMEKVMSDYLLAKRDNIGEIENHVFFFDDIEEIKNDEKNIAKLRPHMVINRGITSYTFCNEANGTFGTITVMMGIILVTLYKKGELEYWENTEIYKQGGEIKAENQIVESVVGQEITHILETANEAMSKLSPKQQERISQIDKTDIKAPIFEEWIKDYRLSNKPC
ncbi:hypothetical protein [Vagococcus lutrae]|uniref:hypothetical protein n=1 Tax=Vagococcus lutrae TaxID=81947 RepID=UPI002010B660|nr:hypothetical protein [Vagococcus lutrae]UQF12568.1 hypothetical protein M2919_04480 [Vagococcus lutrae]